MPCLLSERNTSKVKPRIGKRLQNAGCLAGLLLACAAPSPAQASDDVLDHSFGIGGRVVREAKFQFSASLHPYVESSALHSAQFLNGRIGVLGLNALFGFGPNGRRTGDSGPVEVPKPAGERLYATALTADRTGHVLVAGEVSPDSEEEVPRLGTPVDALIARYDADGKLDQGFGNHGVIVTDLGLPSPLVTEGTFFGSSDPPLPLGSVLGPRRLQISGIAVDALDRIIITGSRGVNRVECRHSPGSISEAFVARLDSAGNLDSTFGENGVVSLHLGSPAVPFNSIGQPVLDPTGGIYVQPGRRHGQLPGIRRVPGVRGTSPQRRLARSGVWLEWHGGTPEAFSGHQDRLRAGGRPAGAGSAQRRAHEAEQQWDHRPAVRQQRTRGGPFPNRRGSERSSYHL